MNRKITCSNNNGISIEFGSKFSPYLLANCDGIYTVSNRVTTSDNTMIDGATYQGSVANKRNIVLTLKDKENHQINRNQLYQLFMPKTKGTLKYEENGDVKSIDYYVESIDITSVNNVRTSTISLICPDPYFEAPSDITVVMAGWKKVFEFLHYFKAEKEPLGIRVEEKLKTIENDTGAEGIGLTIEIYANGPITNPTITHVESNEHITVGTNAHQMNMVAGDKITITTGTNNKKVRFTRNSETTEINEYLDESSEFIQLNAGSNTIGYSAASGDGNMTVSITYRYKYLGV